MFEIFKGQRLSIHRAEKMMNSKRRCRSASQVYITDTLLRREACALFYIRVLPNQWAEKLLTGSPKTKTCVWSKVNKCVQTVLGQLLKRTVKDHVKNHVYFYC
jgi:hypothetical protein